MDYYILACEQNNGIAANNIGIVYHCGRGNLRWTVTWHLNILNWR